MSKNLHWPKKLKQQLSEVTMEKEKLKTEFKIANEKLQFVHEKTNELQKVT